ncbi:MAG: hypothetical protein ACI84R_000903 [Candidatus Azotimanducaceae bacterium]|jgi:hypothetical protein
MKGFVLPAALKFSPKGCSVANILYVDGQFTRINPLNIIKETCAKLSLLKFLV